MRILIVSNRVKTYQFAAQNYFIPLQQLGHEIYWAGDFSNYIGNTDEIPCHIRQIDIVSYPFHLTNIKALRQIKRIIKEDKIDAVQSCTPIGGALGRIAAYLCGIKYNIYAAHGFLFFKGAPLINRTIYKWEELILAHITDTLITINPQDYKAAQEFKLRGGAKPYMIHGAGVKVGVEVNIDVAEKRRSIGVPEGATMLLSAGDLNKNKNNHVIIRALGILKDPNLFYVQCGVGPEEENLRKLAIKCGVENNVLFLGYRTDMPELMKATDIFVMASFREGVPRSIMEAMDMSKPCVGSQTRGVADLIDDKVGGFVCLPKDHIAFANAIKTLMNDKELCRKMGEYNHEKVRDFSYEIVRKEYTDIYKEVLR